MFSDDKPRGEKVKCNGLNVTLKNSSWLSFAVPQPEN